VELIRYQIAYDGAFHTDLGSLPTKEQIRSLGIKALFAVSPNNPTGNCLREEELKRFRELSIPLVIDEVFRPYYDAQALCDPLLGAEDQPLCVVVDGLSKRAAAPGLKLGWMLALGTESQSFLERAEWVSDAYLSAGSLVQHALPEILKREIDIQRNVHNRIRENRHLLKSTDLLSTGITELQTDGGFTALLRFPSTLTEDDWWQLLSAEGIWLSPGHLYELAQAPTFAVSLLTPPAVLAEALVQMKRLVQRRT
jgi:aspartate/methionine/tyrosine aminotransferase